MLVKDIMSKRLVMVGPKETVFAAVKIMVENNISGVVVSENNQAVGIITTKDICKRVLIFGKDVHATPIGDVMSKPVLTVSGLLSVESAAKIMGQRKVKRLVVVDEYNKVEGIVTIMDVVSNLPGMLDIMFQTWVRPDWRKQA